MSGITFTMAQLEKLTAAIAQGALTVQYETNKVEYRSLNEMITLRNLMMKELGLVASQAKRIYLESDKKLS